MAKSVENAEDFVDAVAELPKLYLRAELLSWIRERDDAIRAEEAVAFGEYLNEEFALSAEIEELYAEWKESQSGTDG